MNWLRRCGAHPVFGLCATLLTVAVGGIASVFAEDIRACTDFALFSPSQWNAPASVFWFAGVAVIGFWWARHDALKIEAGLQREENRDAQKLLADRSAELENLIKTRPPREFLEQFAILLSMVEEARRQASSEDERRVVIRAALRHLAGLAKKFDEVEPVFDEPSRRAEHGAANYAANVMLFVGVDGLTEQQREQLAQTVRFDSHIRKHLTDASGLLVLCCHLSARTVSTEEANSDEDDSTPPDPDLKRGFSLAVKTAAKTTDRLKWRVLPGAPRAYVMASELLDKAKTAESEEAELRAAWKKAEADGDAEQARALDQKRKEKMYLSGDFFAEAALSLEHYGDTLELPDWCKQHGDFGHDDLQELEEYFGADSSVKVASMISMPLFGNGGVLGVVNIHSSKPKILQDRRQCGQFVAVTTPFRYIIAQELMNLETWGEVQQTL